MTTTRITCLVWMVLAISLLVMTPVNAVKRQGHVSILGTNSLIELDGMMDQEVEIDSEYEGDTEYEGDSEYGGEYEGDSEYGGDYQAETGKPVEVGSFNLGVPVYDLGRGHTFIMYSDEPVTNRFDGVSASNAEHFIAVNYDVNGHTRWQYTVKDEDSEDGPVTPARRVGFQPVATDFIAFEVYYKNDGSVAVHDFVGDKAMHLSIRKGYVSGDIEMKESLFTSDWGEDNTHELHSFVFSGSEMNRWPVFEAFTDKQDKYMEQEAAKGPATCGVCVHGHCINNTCFCQPGWEGDQCKQSSAKCDDRDSANTQCSGHGSCQDGSCQCIGAYAGDRCEMTDVSLCLNSCSYNGLCFQVADRAPRCICMHGTFGADCSESDCAAGCSVHGTCRENAETGDVWCECDLGYTGTNCDQKACPDCGSHGKCEGTQCICEDGWEGLDCSAKSCSGEGDGCNGHGECQGDTGLCVCESGFSGDACEFDDYLCPNQCSDQGNCTVAGCECEEEWTGDDCSAIRCPADCSGHGLCKEDGTCACAAPWTGSECSEKTCPNQCSGQGVCIDGACHCNNKGLDTEVLDGDAVTNSFLAAARETIKGRSWYSMTSSEQSKYTQYLLDNADVVKFFGDDCSQRACASDCGEDEGRGTCDYATGLCICNAPYAGVGYLDCASTLCDINCGSNGKCVDGACSCYPGDSDGRGGWTGAACDVPICPLNCTEALGQGTCQQGTCVCSEGFSGDDCNSKQCPAAYVASVNAEVPCSGQGTCTTDGKCECHDGYRGKACEAKRCPADCSGNGVCQSNGVCICGNSWKGEDCSLLKSPNEITDEACPGNCYALEGRGVCFGGQCLCKDLYHGLDCGQVYCPNGCSGHGYCQGETGECQCNPGWGGEDCSQDWCIPADCSGHGTCIPAGEDDQVSEDAVAEYGGLFIKNEGIDTLSGSGSSGAYCQCEEPYTGEDCAHAKCDNSCSGHGTCLDDQCFCESGWRGDECEIEICPNNCVPHGSCVTLDDDSAEIDLTDDGQIFEGCRCDEGWTGAACDVGMCDPIDCNGRGSCGSDLEGNPKCVCEPPYGGKACDQMTCDLPCVHGECLDGSCQCEHNWSGELCTDAVCPHDCSGHGICNSDTNPLAFAKPEWLGCKCDAGWTGEGCDQIVCRDPSCGGNGECIDILENAVCKCDAGFRGENCTIAMCTEENDCNGHGICFDDECHCEDGWIGDSCGKELCPNDCSGHGKCNDNGNLLAFNEYQWEGCYCDVGWVGDDCSIPNPCGEVCTEGGTAHGTCTEIASSSHRKSSLFTQPGLAPSTFNNDANIEESEETDSPTDKYHPDNWSCVCKPGWKGLDCTVPIIGPNGGPPCELECNNGKCVWNSDFSAASCQCEDGYGLDDCSGAKCDDDCSDHGECFNDECKCELGWQGDDCSNIDTKHLSEADRITIGYEGGCPDGCSGNGECIKGECFCDDLWFSETCGTQCPMSCGEETGAGRCERGHCVCSYGFKGLECEIEFCEVDCGDNGKCDGHECVCESGWSGQACDVKGCPGDCNGHGTCGANGMCTCNTGYQGEDCSKCDTSESLIDCDLKCLPLRGGMGPDPFHQHDENIDYETCMNTCQQTMCSSQ